LNERERARRRAAPTRAQPPRGPAPPRRGEPAGTVWLFDLDDTLHDARLASFGGIHDAMNAYIERELGLAPTEASALRSRYWQRYGATLLGLVRHHGVRADHFLHDVHRLPGLESRVRGHAHDLAALARLPGRRVLLTNAPAAYAARVLRALGLARCFDAVVPIEAMRMFGQWRPKPDRRMLRRLAATLRVPAARCVLVEDTLMHQKAARAVGMGTVWMQRWLDRWPGRGRLARRPAYVDRRIAGLQQLHRR
jgi:putative hydrolase of the HAD superfamily